MSKLIRRVERSAYDAVLTVLADEAPDLHAELVELRHHNPQAYRKEIRRLVQAGLHGDGFPEVRPLFVRDDDRADHQEARRDAKRRLIR